MVFAVLTVSHRPWRTPLRVASPRVGACRLRTSKASIGGRKKSMSPIGIEFPYNLAPRVDSLRDGAEAAQSRVGGIDCGEYAEVIEKSVIPIDVFVITNNLAGRVDTEGVSAADGRTSRGHRLW